MNERIEVKSHGEIQPKKGMNPRNPYEHQKCAMMCMDQMNELPAYRTLIVLPTGGGKTYTATLWLVTCSPSYVKTHIEVGASCSIEQLF